MERRDVALRDHGAVNRKPQARAGRALGVATFAFASLCAGIVAAPADAQGLGRVFQGITRPLVTPSDPIPVPRFRIARILAPKLAIDSAQAAGGVIGLSPDAGGALLLAVLADGSARLWDLERGAQIGAAIRDGVVAGAVAAGAVVSVRRDGSMTSMRPGGRVWPHGGAPVPIDDGAAVLASDGNTLAFRDRNGDWRAVRGDRIEGLPDAAPEFRPVLSQDGAWAAYRTRRGGPVAIRLGAATTPTPTALVGCGEGSSVAAGAFLSDGRIVFGDERGNICGWRLSEAGGPEPLFTQRAHDGAIGAVAASLGGDFFATRGARGVVRVWSTAPRLRSVAEFAAEDAAAGPLAVDASRRWLFVGEDSGKVAVLSWADGVERRVATLVFTDDGWAVLDAAGRFDGSQTGIDALSWTGPTEETGEARTRPVDAFSENWFEPGLQAKLDDESPQFLSSDPGDLRADGYLAPPTVAIDPIGSPAADGKTRIVVRLADPDYQPDEVAEMRLYHDGKLAPGGESAEEGQARVYRLRLSPGDNRFSAVGVGPGEIEGPPASASATGATTRARRPTMRLVAVGVNDYSASLGPALNLRYPRNDVETVAAALRDRGAALFNGVESAVLLDSTARLAEIENHILRPSTLEKTLSGEDVLVVYLAGHGYALPDDEGQEWYFLPYSADRSAPQKIEDAVREHGLSARKLLRLLTQAEARRVFLVLDSCYSGAALRGIAFDDAARKALRRIARVGGIHVLAAAQADETAIELDLEQHGALTYLVLQGVAGEADENGDGTVSVKEIIAHADLGMPLLSHRLFGGAMVQKPVGYSRGADFPLAKL